MRDEHDIKLKNFSCGTCNEVFHDVITLQQHMTGANHRSVITQFSLFCIMQKYVQDLNSKLCAVKILLVCFLPKVNLI